MPLPLEELRGILLPAVTALVAGLMLGYVIKSLRARRRIDELLAEAAQLRQSLAARDTAAKPDGERAATAFRITGSEIAAIITAIAGLAAAAGTIYINSQSTDLKAARAELSTKSQELNAKGQELAAAREDSKKVLHYDLAKWVALSEGAPVPLPARLREMTLDDKHIRDGCRGAAVKFVYDGVGPAMLRCVSGSPSLHLKTSARILLMPDK